PGSKGNPPTGGGGFDNGHLVLDQGHLWYDGASATLRAKTGAPASGGDGHPLVSGTGSDSHGVLEWGNGADPAFDTGNEVCAAGGLACVSVLRSDGTGARACDDPQSGEFFFALCK